MTIDTVTIRKPKENDRHGLCRLWIEAFGDEKEFFELFMKHGFNSDRAVVAEIDSVIASALYWFDFSLNDRKVAYIYGVATLKEYRGQGLSTRLLTWAHELMKKDGYSGVFLVPVNESLFGFYERHGYATATKIKEFSVEKSDTPTPLKLIDKTEFAAKRREYLPEGSVIQEGAGLDFLAAQYFFFSGEDLLGAGYKTESGRLICPELLGNTEKAPAILTALGCQSGSFRTAGEGRAFSMYLPFTEDSKSPSYFGFAFD